MKCSNCQVPLFRIFWDLKMCPDCRNYVCAWEADYSTNQNSDLQWLLAPSTNEFSQSNNAEPSVDLEPSDDL